MSPQLLIVTLASFFFMFFEFIIKSIYFKNVLKWVSLFSEG